jgi:methylated-DNA-[protein]-cysteine S-methyltransferase
MGGEATGDGKRALFHSSGTTGKPTGCISENRYFSIAELYLSEGGTLRVRPGGESLQRIPVNPESAIIVGVPWITVAESPPFFRSRQVTYAYKLMASPVGELKLVANGNRLAAILWENDGQNRVRLKEMVEENDRPILVETERQLNEYFAHARDHFDLDLDFAGTEFQKKVWQALLTIPFGETRSYSEIAAQIGHASAVRAVGAANGRNPISIIAPCHRVIGASGDLTGFAGGLERKRFLLLLEAGEGSGEHGTAEKDRTERVSAPRSPRQPKQTSLFGNDG